MTFQELLNDERALGHAQGLEEGFERGKIMGMIQTARKYHATDSEILNQLMEDYDLDEEKAMEYLEE